MKLEEYIITTFIQLLMTFAFLKRWQRNPLIGCKVTCLRRYQVPVLAIDSSDGIQLIIKYCSPDKFPRNDHGGEVVPLSSGTVITLDIVYDVATL